MWTEQHIKLLYQLKWPGFPQHHWRKETKGEKNRLLFYSIYASVTISQARNKPDPLWWALCARVRAFSCVATEAIFAFFVCPGHRGAESWAGSIGRGCCSALVAQWRLSSQWQPCCFHSCSSVVICYSSSNLFPPAAAFLDVQHSRRLPSHPKEILGCVHSQAHAKGPTRLCHESCKCEGYSSLCSQVAGGKKQL